MSELRTLSEIIEAVKSNAEVSDEELRLAVVAQDFLMSFDHRALMNLREAELQGKKPNLVYSADWQCKERIRRLKNAMGQNPKNYLGVHNLPESPEYQKRRAVCKKLVEKVVTKSLKITEATQG